MDTFVVSFIPLHAILVLQMYGLACHGFRPLIGKTCA